MTTAVKLKLFISALLFLSSCGVIGSALTAADVPQFHDYSVRVYSGPMRAPDLSSHPDAKTYRTRLRNAAKGKVNFAGEYILATWGCGANCLMGAAINARTGKVVFVPHTVCCWDVDKDTPIEFKRDSNLTVFTGLLNEETLNATHYFEFRGGQFHFIRRQAVAAESLTYGAADAKYVTSSQNPAVLQYIQCLEKAVGETPRNVAVALAGAADACKSLEKELPSSPDESDAETILLSIQECGFRPGDASPDVDCGQTTDSGNVVVAADTPPATDTYDASWHKSDFWGGEYPRGFTLTKDVTTKIRSQLDPQAPWDIDCALEKGATYHPWNGARVDAAKIEFVSYGRMVPYVVTKPIKVITETKPGDEEVTLAFNKGDEWTYRAYYGEGLFEMAFMGKIYAADQELMEASKEKAGQASPDGGPDEWMKLTCANGVAGWLLMSDTNGQPGFASPNILEYGKSADRR